MLPILRFLIRVLLRLIARFEIRGTENVPATGGIVIASNHIGILDIIMVILQWTVPTYSSLSRKNGKRLAG